MSAHIYPAAKMSVDYQADALGGVVREPQAGSELRSWMAQQAVAFLDEKPQNPNSDVDVAGAACGDTQGRRGLRERAGPRHAQHRATKMPIIQI